jgi:hypothetical protein
MLAFVMVLADESATRGEHVMAADSGAEDEGFFGSSQADTGQVPGPVDVAPQPMPDQLPNPVQPVSQPSLPQVSDPPASIATAPEQLTQPEAPPAPAKPAQPKQAAMPAEGSRKLAETVVSSIVDRLLVEASRKGGWLTIDDIEGLRREFEGKTSALQQVFEKSFEEYIKVRERAAWDQARQYPFDRLIVQRYASVFSSDGGPPLDQGGLSRRMLPGFFMSMSMMLGPEIAEVYQEQCRRLVAKIREENDGKLDWYDVYDDHRTRTLGNDAVVAIAGHFQDLAKRGLWFIDLVNGHLAPPDVNREGPGVEDWELSERGYLLMLDALLGDVRNMMESDTGRLRLTKAYSSDNVLMLADLLQRLDVALATGLNLGLD